MEQDYEINKFRSSEPPYKIVANLNPNARSHQEPVVLVQRDQISEFMSNRDRKYERSVKWDELVKAFRDIMLSEEYGWDDAVCYGSQCLLEKRVKPQMWI